MCRPHTRRREVKNEGNKTVSKIKSWSPLACLLGIVLSTASPVKADTPAVVIPIAYNAPTQDRVYAGVPVVERLMMTFADLPDDKLRQVLLLAYCESAGWVHRYPSGELRPHQDDASSARGVMQVLAGLHAPELRERGLDLEREDDYFEFVRILYDRGGLAAWESSLPCMRGETELGQKAQRELDQLLNSPLLAGLM